MGSSGSTRDPGSNPAVPLWLLVADEDHPRACTGRKLLHRGLARAAPRRFSREPIVLDPHAHVPLSGADRDRVERGGLLVVDCSWNRLSARGRFPDHAGGGDPPGTRRRLPLLLAANPQHFGRLAELNTAEAFSAALYLLGWPAQASIVLEGFRGGSTFLELNRARLDEYARARLPADVLSAERALFGPGGSVRG